MRLLLGVCGLLVAVLAFGSTGNAAPPGIEPGLKKVFQFNLIGYPEGKVYNGQCGQGSRIFVNRNARHAHILITDDDDGWYVSDCDATGNSRGELHTDDVGDYIVYARILGKPGGSLDICADTLEDHEDGSHLCEVGTYSLKREGGKSRFSVAPSAIFDAELEDLIWSVETNSNFRNAQFRVYRRN